MIRPAPPPIAIFQPVPPPPPIWLGSRSARSLYFTLPPQQEHTQLQLERTLLRRPAAPAADRPAGAPTPQPEPKPGQGAGSQRRAGRTPGRQQRRCALLLRRVTWVSPPLQCRPTANDEPAAGWLIHRSFNDAAARPSVAITFGVALARGRASLRQHTHQQRASRRNTHTGSAVLSADS